MLTHRGTVLRLALSLGLVLTFFHCAQTSRAATAWQATGSMSVPRAGHTMTRLPNGRVMVTGGANLFGQSYSLYTSTELYIPASGTWKSLAPMRVPRYQHSATILNDGTVLAIGGVVTQGASTSTATTEVYDPVSNTWSDGPSMRVPRAGHTAVLLPTGEVFVAGSAPGGTDGASAELFDPITGEWRDAAPMSVERTSHTTTVLADGRVLVAGGNGLATAEIYNPGMDSWSSAGTMSSVRDQATATRLNDGKVLVAGGESGSTTLATADLYDPVLNSWSSGGTMPETGFSQMATILADGSVLVAGGALESAHLVSSVAIYNPSANAWTRADAMLDRRAIGGIMLLADGSVLACGGLDLPSVDAPVTLAAAERYPSNQLPTITRSPIQSLRLGVLRPTQAPVTVTWGATDADGIGAYQVRRQIDGGAYTAVTLPAADSTIVTQFLTPGSVHRYRLRATDGRGTQSDAVLGPSATLDARNETDASIAYTGTWTTQALAKFFGGAVRLAGTANAKATLTFTGTSVSWVTTRGPGRGIAEVRLDGVTVATIDLYSATFRVRQAAFARNGLTSGTHTLEIRVLGTHNAASTGNRVDIDAFVVLR